MYISEISGHHQATRAIENALKFIDPNANILNINAFNYTNPLSEKIINKLYTHVIKRTPKIWDLLYDNPKVVKSTQRIKNIIHRFNSTKLKILFDNFRPHVVACTQAFPCGMVADLKKIYNLNVPLVGILTDFIPHAYWIYNTVDYYIVACSEAKNRFLSEGVPSERILTLGIPIDLKFTQSCNRDRFAQKLGLDLSLPTILIMGGGQGLGPLKKIVRLLGNLKLNFQLIIVTGTNRRLHKYLIARRLLYKKKMVILEYADNINELMDISSLIITKAGGLTIAEALSKNLPMLIINPIPGQEENNTRYLLNKAAALTVEDIEDIGSVVEETLSYPSKLLEMSEVAKMIGRPNAAKDIAEIILKLCLTTSSTKSVNTSHCVSPLK
jgi:processive 1,2-diacylglycerol beta-glucosyltransferase